MTENESYLSCVIALLQYKIARLEGLTEEDAHRVATVALTGQRLVLSGNLDLRPDPEAFAIQIERSKQVLDRMILSSKQQYQEADMLP